MCIASQPSDTMSWRDMLLRMPEEISWYRRGAFEMSVGTMLNPTTRSMIAKATCCCR